LFSFQQPINRGIVQVSGVETMLQAYIVMEGDLRTLSQNNILLPRQGGYVIVVVCLFVRLFVCLLATLRKNFLTDLHGIFREGWQSANEQI